MQTLPAIIFLSLLFTVSGGPLDGYLKKLLRSSAMTTIPRSFPVRKRPVDQDEETTTKATEVTTEGSQTTENPDGSTIEETTKPPGTKTETVTPEGSTMPPGPTGIPDATTTPPPGPNGSTTTAGPTTAKCSVGVWSEWREEMGCNAACGACGTVVRRRSCTTAAAGCPCDGDFRETRPCQIAACDYPQPACCPPFKLQYINGTFACGPQSEAVLSEYLSQLAARVSTSTRSSTSPLIATKPHRTSPSGGNGTTTITTSAVTTTLGPSVAPTGGPDPKPTEGPGPAPTRAPETTQHSGSTTDATPEEKTTEEAGEGTTPGEEEAEMAVRPWYHRFRPMKRISIDGDSTDYPSIQYLDFP